MWPGQEGLDAQFRGGSGCGLRMLRSEPHLGRRHARKRAETLWLPTAFLPFEEIAAAGVICLCGRCLGALSLIFTKNGVGVESRWFVHAFD